MKVFSYATLIALCTSPIWALALVVVNYDTQLFDATIAEIPSIQTAYFDDFGEYKQVIDKVNVYESPDGWGYQTVEQLPDMIVFTGYGALAKDYTYNIPLGGIASTSDLLY